VSEPRFRAWTDGASRGNPGPAALGVSIEDEAGTEVATASETIGRATNNVAEYRALLRAIELLTELGAKRVQFLLDSELVVRQMNGEYRVKDPKMRALYDEVQSGLGAFAHAAFRHVPRAENMRADALANQALDRAGG
jgi:ribonuclease HI